MPAVGSLRFVYINRIPLSQEGGNCAEEIKFRKTSNN
jgi:hypothetical protein